MRNLTLRPGETFVIGDTAITAGAPAEHARMPESSSQVAMTSNSIKDMPTRRWVAAYEREERRQEQAARFRIRPGD